MIKKLSFNDWIELYQDELPEEGDLYPLYEEYLESVVDSEIETALINKMH
ncbi:hypothetical protein HOR54_gp19 [Vibrio phage Vp670]|uniref:Uncharacterized protein n=1 Tax=Vibrio phage Vp670 TaxID=1932890 RepID=A0A1L7DPY9_9CAUD|nr:hypothetical protein HOR54_gp19 [Vibrio phage Vp670]APU00156.1 hypothetical protein QD07_19 [Vibrio phage Vp670]